MFDQRGPKRRPAGSLFDALEGWHDESPVGVSPWEDDAIGETPSTAWGEIPHRAEMEATFRADFSGVRAHLGLDDALDPFDADAAARGDDVVFASTSPEPALVAHELAHVQQQRNAGGGAHGTGGGESRPDDEAEREADTVAAQVGGGARHVAVSAQPSAAVHFNRRGGPPKASYSAQGAEALSDDDLDQLALRSRHTMATSEDADLARGDLYNAEWAASQRGHDLAAPAAGSETVSAGGYVFSSNPEHVRFVLERVIAERGLAGARKIIPEVTRAQGSGEPAMPGAGAGSRATAPGIAGIVERELASMEADAADFLTTFEQAGRAEIERQLDASEATVRGAISRYGIQWSPAFEAMLAPFIASDDPNPINLAGAAFEAQLAQTLGGALGVKQQPLYSIAQNKETSSLVATAQEIQAAQGRTKRANAKFDSEINRLARLPENASRIKANLEDLDDQDWQVDEGYGGEARDLAESQLRDDMAATAERAAIGEASGPGSPPVSTAAVNLAGDAKLAGDTQAETTAVGEAAHPILAAFRNDEIGQIAGASPDQLAKTIAREVLEKLGNIRKVRSGLSRGKYSVWKLPRIVTATSQALHVPDGSWRARVRDEKIQQAQDDGMWVHLALTVLGVGLSLLAAVPTGGSSLAAGASTAAAVGGTMLDVYTAGTALSNYDYQHAAAHSDFDPYKAIADHDPDFTSVVMSLAAAGVGVAATVSIIRRASLLKDIARRAAASGDAELLARMRQLRQEVNAASSGSGIDPPLGDQVVANTVGDAAVGAKTEATATEKAGAAGTGETASDAAEKSAAGSERATASETEAPTSETEAPTSETEATTTPETEATTSTSSEVGEASKPTAPRGKPVRRPAARHTLKKVTQGSVAKEVNTVIEPRVDVAADVEAINAGNAQFSVTDNGVRTYTVNGRTYGVEPNGTLYPMTGDGFIVLNRNAYKVLGIFNKFGDGARGAQIIELMRPTAGITDADVEAARGAWRAGRGG